MPCSHAPPRRGPSAHAVTALEAMLHRAELGHLHRRFAHVLNDHDAAGRPVLEGRRLPLPRHVSGCIRVE